MLRELRRIPVFLLCASLPALGSGAAPVAAEIFPAGARLSFPDQSLVTFKINAAGPSVLWVTASCPALQSLAVSSGEAMAVVEDAAGSAECVIPIHAAGLVEVTVRTRGDGRGAPVILTSYYGIGDIRDTVIEPARAASAPAPVAPVPPAVSTPPASSPAPASPATPAPSAAPAVATATSPAPPVAASSPPRETVSPPPPGSIDHRAPAVTLGTGEWKTGSFPSAGAVVTYRVYVPNRLGFSVHVAGSCAFRVQAERGAFDRSEKEGSEGRIVNVAAPTDGHYLVSLKGEGSYGLKVEVR